jgi:putative lipoic acid-binding regulatory protein
MAMNGASDGGKPASPVPGGQDASVAPADTLIVYPSPFPIKVMGPAAPGFVPAVVAVVQRHAPDFDPATIETRSSREGKYTSLTATVVATSREQLDALYRDLCDHPMVVMVL